MLFEHRRVRVAEDIVRLPSGEEISYVVLVAGPGVAVLPLTDDGRVVLTREYRYPIRETIYALPGGGIRRGEALDDAARRELREEIGLDAATMITLGYFYPNPARATTKVHVFLARDLQHVPRDLESTEQIEAVFLPVAEAMALLAQNQIRDAATIFALVMAEKKGYLQS
jgi:ADP-ribose pyrophosphatase